MLFPSRGDPNLFASSRDKCGYYNRTTNNIFTSAYEGIPENLLLNFLGWMVGSRFDPVDKWSVTHIHTSESSGQSRPIGYQWELQTAHFNRIKQLSDHFCPHNPLILSPISNFLCCMAKHSGTPVYYYGFSWTKLWWPEYFYLDQT